MKKLTMIDYGNLYHRSFHLHSTTQVRQPTLQISQQLQISDNKLLFCVWLILQNLQWAVGVDDNVLTTCFGAQSLQKILEFIMKTSYNVIYYQEGQAYISKSVLQQKRYSSKILTLIFREFSSVLGQKLYLEAIQIVYKQSVKMLIYFLPFYLQMVTFNQNLNDAEQSFEDFEMEFQSLIVQVLSLISTLISQKPKQILKENKSLQQPLLYVMFGYSLMGLDQEKLFGEDQNMFLIAFFDDNEDEMSNVSIRSVVSEVITESLCHSEFDRKILEQTIQQFILNEIPAQALASHEKKLYIGSLKSIGDIEPSTDLCIPLEFNIQKQEEALFVLGSQAQQLNVSQQILDQTLQTIQSQDASVILKLRGLWLLEKASQTFQNKIDIAKTIFQSLSEYFIHSTDFVILYQCLKTIHKYLKIVNIQQNYPEMYQSLLCSFIVKTNSLMIMCNDETIHVPIEGLAFLSKIDQESCAKTASEVMPGMLEAYKKYHLDGLLGDDIVELIKIWASVPNNDAFLVVFFPHIYQVIKSFQEISLSQNPSLAQKMLDSSVIKNMLSILASYMLSNSLSIVENKSQQYQQMDEIFKMLIDILNSTKEIYTALYTVLCLSTFCQALPQVAKIYSEVLIQVIKKIIAVGSGLDESSCLYLGHLIVVLLDNEIVDSNTQQQLVVASLQRLSRAQLPSSVKSFILPVALSIIKYGKQIIEFLQTDNETLRKALNNWLQNSNLFEGEFAKKISKLALISLLEYSTQNLQFASMPQQFSQYNKKESNLQARLVFILVKDLIMGDNPQNDKDDQSYGGDDYGDNDSYGDEDMGKGEKDKLGGENNDFDIGDNFGDDDDSGDTENNDEKLLMSIFVQKYNLSQPTNELLARTMTKIGKVTMSKIVALEFDEEPAFSPKEQEVLMNLFA